MSETETHTIDFLCCTEDDGPCDFSSWEVPEQDVLEGSPCPVCGSVLVFDMSLTVSYP